MKDNTWYMILTKLLVEHSVLFHIIDLQHRLKIKVFHIHIISDTFKLLVASNCLYFYISPFTVGGANKVSFMVNKNNNNVCHVSFSILFETWVTCCSVRRTRWHKTACLLITSVPNKKPIIQLHHYFQISYLQQIIIIYSIH